MSMRYINSPGTVRRRTGECAEHKLTWYIEEERVSVRTVYKITWYIEGERVSVRYTNSPGTSRKGECAVHKLTRYIEEKRVSV